MELIIRFELMTSSLPRLSVRTHFVALLSLLLATVYMFLLQRYYNPIYYYKVACVVDFYIVTQSAGFVKSFCYISIQKSGYPYSE